MASIVLSPELDQSVDALIAPGRYRSREDVATRGVHLLVETETGAASGEPDRAVLRAMIQEGIDAVAAGNVVELDEAFDRIDVLIEAVAARAA